MAWPPAQKDVGITPLDWNFFFYLYTLAFASAFLCPTAKEAERRFALPTGHLQHYGDPVRGSAVSRG
jgi:hypothetical protein